MTDALQQETSTPMAMQWQTSVMLGKVDRNYPASYHLAKQHVFWECSERREKTEKTTKTLHYPLVNSIKSSHD